MDYDSYLSPFSLRFFFKELLIITFSYNLQLILFLVSACISVPNIDTTNRFEFPSQTYIPYKVHHYGNSALPYLHHDL